VLTSEVIGRSDTMIYMVVRPKVGDLLAVSIPRDTYVGIVGKDKYNGQDTLNYVRYREDDGGGPYGAVSDFLESSDGESEANESMV
jgi:anionic cell wall polymer biosynthesis LytR-Cps2A-Psr (LCP) family protein